MRDPLQLRPKFQPLGTGRLSLALVIGDKPHCAGFERLADVECIEGAQTPVLAQEMDGPGKDARPFCVRPGQDTLGQVLVDGRDVTALPMYRRARLGVGYLPQEVSIFRGLSAEDNILAVLEIAEPDRHKRREKLEELLSEFSITHIRHAPALALSGGERRRVEIARCLAADPKYLLLDEPFAGVDPIAVDEIRQLVRTLKSRGLGVLITDHNVRETLEIVDRAYILHDGKILMTGTSDEIVRDETVRRVYLGENFRIA